MVGGGQVRCWEVPALEERSRQSCDEVMKSWVHFVIQIYDAVIIFLQKELLECVHTGDDK